MIEKRESESLLLCLAQIFGGRISNATELAVGENEKKARSMRDHGVVKDNVGFFALRTTGESGGSTNTNILAAARKKGPAID